LSPEAIAALKAKGKPVVRKDKKTGREYPLQDLVITAAYPPEEAAAPAKSKGTAKPAGKPAAKGKAAVVDIDDLTTSFLQGLVADAGEEAIGLRQEEANGRSRRRGRVVRLVGSWGSPHFHEPTAGQVFQDRTSARAR
jgi:hypothetical protein